MWTQIFLLLAVALMGWLLYRQIKGNPEGFTRENMGKSLYTLGILAILLVAFIAFLVAMLKG